MDETRIRSLEDIAAFLEGTADAMLELRGDKDEIYAWIERTLVRFRYLWLSKAGKGLVRSYMMRLTGYSRAQLERLIAQYR